MIKHLMLNNKYVDQYQKIRSKGVPVVTDMSKINVFVGPNNSGKSRMIRNVLTNELLAFEGLIEDDIRISDNFSANGSDLRSHAMSNWVEKIMGYHVDGELTYKELFMNVVMMNNDYHSYPSLVDAMLKVACGDGRLDNVSFSAEDGLINFIIDRFARMRDSFNPPRRNVSRSVDYSRMYIPLLRGLRPLIHPGDLIESFGAQAGSQQVNLNMAQLVESIFGYNQKPAFDALHDLYKKSTIRDYPELKNGVGVYTGLSIYWDIKTLLLGNEASRQKVRRFQRYLTKHFFEGQEVELVPKIDTPGILHVSIGRKKDIAIHNLGDGIQAIITLLYPLFTQLESSRPTLVGIEEPENNLHPGLQRQFFNALNHFENAQFLITTHSNHLIHAIEEVDNASIYRVENHSYEVDGAEHDITRFQGTDYGDFKTLELLGVLNTSVFLSNCTIWVEGPTDRRIFKYYLKLYLDHLKGGPRPIIEDKHYTFVEYGGSNITHFSVLNEDPAPINVEHLCGKLMLVADGDNAKGKKEVRHSHLAESLGERFVLLNCKEVENLCSPEVITKIIRNFLPADSNFVFSSKWDAYKDKGLGKFIDGVIERNGLKLTKGKKMFADADSIREKGQFCNLTIQNTQKWEDLTPEAQRVIVEIHKFIIKSNFKI